MSAAHSLSTSIWPPALHAFSHYIWTMGITFIVMVANILLILAYAPTASTAVRLAIAISIVSITAFGALGGRAELEELKAINEDHIEVMPGTRYAKNLAGLPMGLFTALTVVLICVAGLVQLYALFTA